MQPGSPRPTSAGSSDAPPRLLLVGRCIFRPIHKHPPRLSEFSMAQKKYQIQFPLTIDTHDSLPGFVKRKIAEPTALSYDSNGNAYRVRTSTNPITIRAAVEQLNEYYNNRCVEVEFETL